MLFCYMCWFAAKLTRELSKMSNKTKKFVLDDQSLVFCTHDISKMKIYFKSNRNASPQDQDGKTPLHHAVKNRQLDSVNFLLARGANPDVQDHQGAAPLHYAVWVKDCKIVRALAANKADLNIKDCKGRTPIHFATGERHLGIATFLRGFGADCSIKDNKGETPYVRASMARKKSPLKVLNVLYDQGRQTDRS